MQARESFKPQTLEEMVDDLFPKSILDLSAIPTHIAEVDTATLLQLIADIPSVQLKEHFNFATQDKFLKALVARNIKISERQMARLQAIPPDVFPRLVLASRDLTHLTETLNIDAQWIGKFIKEENFLDMSDSRTTGNFSAYSSYKCQLLIKHKLFNSILEQHVSQLGSNRKTINAIAQAIGCNEADTFHFVSRSAYWGELAEKYKTTLAIPPPAAADTTYLAYVRLAEPKEVAPPFSRTDLDDECPMFEGALASICQPMPVIDLKSIPSRSTDETQKWTQETIAKLATTFHRSIEDVRDFLSSSESAMSFKKRMGKNLTYHIRSFLKENNINFFELKTGKNIHEIREMIRDLYQYTDGELKLKTNFRTLARKLGVSEITFVEYLRENNTSFPSIIIEDLTPSCLFAILKTAKGNKPKICLDIISETFGCGVDLFQSSLKHSLGISLLELANTLLPAMSNENFKAISEKYTQRIGEMTEVQRCELLEELRRLAATAPSISVWVQQRTDVENPRAIKAPRI